MTIRRVLAVVLLSLLMATPAFAQVELFSNNSASTLATAINTTDTSVVVASGQGALFPAVSGSDFFFVTLESGSVREVVKVTARATDTLTVVRAQQDTAAASWSIGAKVEQRLTKGTLDNFRQDGVVLVDADVANTITLDNLTQVTTRAIADTTGTLAVSRGGTNLTASADDNVMVGDGTTWQTKAIADCDNATTSKLLYDTATNAFSCGTDQTGGSETVLVLGSQVSTGANTTLVDLTGMSFTADADGLYKVTIFAAINNAAATTGFGIGVNCAQATQTVWMTGTTQLANTGTVTTWSAIANNAIVGVTSGLPTANADVPTHGGGLIKAHATTSGTCIFRLRSETTAVARMQAGSTFVVKKVN
jgi:hypothetical protein